MAQNSVGEAAAVAPKVTFDELGLSSWKTSEVLKDLIKGHLEKWETFSAEDKERIIDAKNKLVECDRIATEAIADITCAIAKYDGNGAEAENKCVKYVLDGYRHRSDKIARSAFTRMAANSTELSILFAREVFGIIERIDVTQAHTPGDRDFIHAVLDLLPDLFRWSDHDDKDNFYQMLLKIADKMDAYIREEDIPTILDCLEFGIGNVEENCDAANRTIIYFSKNIEVGPKYSTKALKLLLGSMQNICYRDYDICWDDHEFVVTMFDTIQNCCKKLGDGVVPHVPLLMERLLSEMNPFTIGLVSTEIIGVIRVVFDAITDEIMQPFHARLTEKCKQFLELEFASYEQDVSAEELASLIGDNRFMRFFIGVVTSVLEETDNSAVIIALYSLFDETPLLESTGVLPQIVQRMVKSVKMSEANDDVYTKNEKIQAMVSLESLARTTGAAFAPFAQSCYGAVYDQLDHSESCIRMASVDTLAQFVVSVSISNVEQAQKIGAEVIRKFANILKMESSVDDACDIFDTYKKLLRKSPIVFDGKIQVFNEVSNCVSDVMGSKLTCQTGSDFFEKIELIRAAFGAFLALSTAMKPFEFAVYFSSILPVLRDKLEDAKQNKSGKAKSFVFLAYHALTQSINILKAYANTSFDVLFPLFVSGMEDEYEKTRRAAIKGLEELVVNAREKAREESVQLVQQFSTFLASEQCAAVIDAAYGAIARIMANNGGLMPVERFLPEIVENLEKIRVGQKYVFECFHVLLNQQNTVLLTLLHPIILNGLREIDSRPTSKNNEAREVIIGFLKECRHSFGYLFEQALNKVPNAAEVVKKL